MYNKYYLIFLMLSGVKEKLGILNDFPNIFRENLRSKQPYVISRVEI